MRAPIEINRSCCTDHRGEVMDASRDHRHLSDDYRRNERREASILQRLVRAGKTIPQSPNHGWSGQKL
jgi:hypothetical protein